jgi:hypothetical protein
MTDRASAAYTPTTGYAGPDSFTFKVNDGLLDSAPATVSITITAAQVTPSAFVTGKVLRTLKNDFTGWLGMKFTVGASPLTVTALGRTFASGNSLTHIVKLIKDSKLKVQGSIQGDAVRVSGAKKDLLQEAIALVLLKLSSS